MFAYFHDWGTRASLKELFKMFEIGAAKRSAFSLSTQLGMPSGPPALLEFNIASFLNTENLVMQKSCDSSSIVVCDLVEDRIEITHRCKKCPVN